MSNARAAILARLRAAPPKAAAPLPLWRPPVYDDPAERVSRFAEILRGQHAEVLETTAADWPQALADYARSHGLRSLMTGGVNSAPARQLRDSWAGQTDKPLLLAYDSAVEQQRERLIHEADAGLTGSVGGIAETGSVILWPDAAEPRLLSLLPPLHIVLVEESKIVSSLAEAIAAGGWAGRMPTNLLLISGPSKTADIEQTLAYGVHGPKELLVLLLRDS